MDTIAVLEPVNEFTCFTVDLTVADACKAASGNPPHYDICPLVDNIALRVSRYGPDIGGADNK